MTRAKCKAGLQQHRGGHRLLARRRTRPQSIRERATTGGLLTRAQLTKRERVASALPAAPPDACFNASVYSASANALATGLTVEASRRRHWPRGIVVHSLAARAQEGALVVDSYSTDAVGDKEHDEAAYGRSENDECRRGARER